MWSRPTPEIVLFTPFTVIRLSMVSQACTTDASFSAHAAGSAAHCSAAGALWSKPGTTPCTLMSPTTTDQEPSLLVPTLAEPPSVATLIRRPGRAACSLFISSTIGCASTPSSRRAAAGNRGTSGRSSSLSTPAAGSLRRCVVRSGHSHVRWTRPGSTCPHLQTTCPGG